MCVNICVISIKSENTIFWKLRDNPGRDEKNNKCVTEEESISEKLVKHFTVCLRKIK